ncbi:hypothetical protein QTJ16_004601 [Diplocarpon rosae]|uniref:Uncharacterized protein n=1 Tax=Diplocarpon rosae TaxID=946125 RepID=A0AAD9T096_9HELO|nr:hypothetical protein QTJ16_004601 [Diplocarpon rosae]PBP20358.1 hypothetical protein BUE80_DR008879 [Diplocarpon rosae]
MPLGSLAISRKNASHELAHLAEEHRKHDLQQSDRDTLDNAAQKFGRYTTLGSLAGLGLGVVLAFRVRRTRAEYFKAFRAMEKPTHVQFAGGRIEALPDITPLLKPTTFGDLAAYMLFSTGGLFLGGELGLLAGSYAARRTITRDPDSKARIEKAFKAFKADVLRREIAQLEGGKEESGPLDVLLE